MSPTLRRYVMSLYLKTLALATVGVLLIFLVIDFGDRLKFYVGHRILDVAELYACKLAVTLGQLMPAAMLLAAGLALTVMQRRGELSAMRALGISPASVVAAMLWCAVPLGVALVAFDEWVAAPAGARVDRLMVERFGVWGDYRYFYGSQRWLRLGPDVFRLAAEKVTVFHLGPGFSLAQRTDATAMSALASGAFELLDPKVRDYPEDDVKEVFPSGAPREWGDSSEGSPHLRAAEREEVRFASADPRAFAIRPGRPEQMSSAELREQEQLRAAAGLPTVRLKLAKHGRFSYPLLGAVGALLASAAALRRGRRIALTVALIEGLAVSAAMWGLLVVGRSLALSERLAPAAAAWGPVVALALAGGWLLRRVEKSS